MAHHYYDDQRHEPAVAEPEPVRLWAETWIELPTSWEGVSIEPWVQRQSILTWPMPGCRYRHQSAIVSNGDLAGLLWA